MSISPRVSVIMPAYNVERYVEHAVLSVLDQDFYDLELIFVDDGSTDSTLTRVEEIGDRDSRLKIISQMNAGRPSIARNRGIAIAKGDYLTFLDSDDYWLPTRVGKMVAGLDNHPDWVAAFHDLNLIDAEGGDLGKIYLADADFISKAAPWLTDLGDGWNECNRRFFVFMSLLYAAVHTQSIMIARSRLPCSQLSFDSNFVICEDTDFWIRVAMCGSVGFLNEVLSSYRQHEGSITQNKLRFSSQTVLFHKHNYRRIEDLISTKYKRKYQVKIANLIRELGYFHYIDFDFQSARSAYWEALSIDAKFSDFIALGKTILPRSLLRQLRKMQEP